ncbi:gastrula zinc finger protein XlCGF57.1-like [Wyeomyia smithii]|uniref:gastrula zinc finger protein XlCGF57.1-like n=1 Tax=Wyeomyia smithii TaxID=174621 RepID=UPI002468139E|nr:gastrula zinc finger protein XlCGF57.1-like [Wyeomyia smithii]
MLNISLISTAESLTMLGKYDEPPENIRNRSNAVPMSIPMIALPTYQLTTSTASTLTRRPNENASIINTSIGPSSTAVTNSSSSESSVKQLSPQYQCLQCLKYFNNTSALSLHMDWHENEQRAASSSSGYNGQMVSVNDIKREPQPFQIVTQTIYPGTFQVVTSIGQSCDICQKVFNTAEQFHAHMKIHEGEYRNRALYQSNNTNVEQLAAGQLPIKEQEPEECNEKPLDCIVCHQKFQTAPLLALHLREHSTQKPYACNICGKGFIQSNNLSTHMKVHSGQKPFKCDICNKNFSQSNNLKTHVRTHTNERPYACTICEKRFNQKNNLTTHMRTHSLVCRICRTRFQNTTELTDHIRVCYADQKPNICTTCNKVFIGEEELAEHMKQHNQAKPHKCQICLKSFTQSNNLKTHMKTHIFHDPFKCPFCSRSFPNQEEFERHSLVHSSPKPFSCPYCGKQFIQSNNLKTHVRTHTGEKPYKCYVCDRLFNQKNNLNTHMRIHQGLKPYQCTVCEKRFNQSNNLNKHIYKVHCHEKALAAVAVPLGTGTETGGAIVTTTGSVVATLDGVGTPS